MEKKLYTLLVYSENVAGVLSQVTAVFTRRQVNIESIVASASSLDGIHRYTITAWSDEEQMEKITRQIEKVIDVVKADYYLDEQLFIYEIALYKISAPMLLDNPEVSRAIRKADARMMEVNPTYATVEQSGLPEELDALYGQLNALGCILQFSRSGRIAVPRSSNDPLTDFLSRQSADDGRQQDPTQSKISCNYSAR